MKTIIYFITTLFILIGLVYLCVPSYPDHSEFQKLLELQNYYENGDEYERRILTLYIIEKAEGKDLPPDLRGFVALLKFKVKQNQSIKIIP